VVDGSVAAPAVLPIECCRGVVKAADDDEYADEYDDGCGCGGCCCDCGGACAGDLE
jgi:hypothetical protein